MGPGKGRASSPAGHHQPWVGAASGWQTGLETRTGLRIRMAGWRHGWSSVIFWDENCEKKLRKLPSGRHGAMATERRFWGIFLSAGWEVLEETYVRVWARRMRVSNSEQWDGSVRVWTSVLGTESTGGEAQRAG